MDSHTNDNIILNKMIILNKLISKNQTYRTNLSKNIKINNFKDHIKKIDEKFKELQEEFNYNQIIINDQLKIINKQKVLLITNLSLLKFSWYINTIGLLVILYNYIN